MADKFDTLSPEDQAKFALLEAEWERDGDIVFDRLGETDPAFYLRLVALIRPKAVPRRPRSSQCDQPQVKGRISLAEPIEYNVAISLPLSLQQSKLCLILRRQRVKLVGHCDLLFREPEHD